MQDLWRSCTSMSNYLAATTFPISVPIRSPEMTISTRRFSWRPCAVSLDATGWLLPNPLAVTEVSAILVGQVFTHSIAALFGELLVVCIAANAVRVAFHIELQSRMSRDDAGHLGQLFASERSQ